MKLALINDSNDCLRVKLGFWHNHLKRYMEFEAILDSGASKTTIDTNLAKALFIPIIGNPIKVTTASGEVDAYNGNLASLELVKNKEITDVPITVMPLIIKILSLMRMNLILKIYNTFAFSIS